MHYQERSHPLVHKNRHPEHCHALPTVQNRQLTPHWKTKKNIKFTHENEQENDKTEYLLCLFQHVNRSLLLQNRTPIHKYIVNFQEDRVA